MKLFVLILNITQISVILNFCYLNKILKTSKVYIEDELFCCRFLVWIERMFNKFLEVFTLKSSKIKIKTVMHRDIPSELYYIKFFLEIVQILLNWELVL